MNRNISQPSALQENFETPSSETGVAQSDTREILFLTAGLLALVFGLGGLMMYSDEEPLPATASQEIDHTQMGTAPTPSDLQPAKTEPTAFSQLPAEELVNDSITPAAETRVGQTAEKTAGQALEGTDVYFAFNEWTLSDEAKEAIRTRVENRPEGWTGTINIVGYTDSRGPDAYNRSLGLKRARSVQSYMVSLGVPEKDIQVETLGQDIQVCQEAAPTCFEQNRRAHIAFLPSSTPQGEDIQLSMSPSSLNASAGEEPAEDASPVSSGIEGPLQEETHEKSVVADPPATVESLP